MYVTVTNGSTTGAVSPLTRKTAPLGATKFTKVNDHQLKNDLQQSKIKT